MRGPTRWLAVGIVLSSVLALGPADAPPPARGEVVSHAELHILEEEVVAQTPDLAGQEGTKASQLTASD